MKLTKLSTVTMLALASSVAMANDDSNRQVFTTLAKPAAVGVEVGLLGYGANVAWGVNDSVELQAGWAGVAETEGTLDTSKILDFVNKKDDLELPIPNAQATARLKMSNPYLGVQLRPFKNWLTVGTGVIVPQQSLSLEATTSENKTFSIKGYEHTLEAGDSLKIELENRNKLAPYLTVGVRPNINSRFGISAEVGAAYTGKYDSYVTVTPTANNANTANTASQYTGDQNQYDKLRSDIEDELNNVSLPVFPIVKLGATLRF